MTKLKRLFKYDPLQASLYDPWLTAAEVIGNKYCLRPETVRQSLFKLGTTPAKAFKEAINFSTRDFEGFLNFIINQK